MKLELQTLGNIRRHGVSIYLAGTVHRQLGQVVSLEFYTVEAVISAQLVDLFLGIRLAHGDIAVLVARELVEEILLRETLAVLGFRAECLRYGERRHDGGVVDGVVLDLVAYIDRIGQRLGYVTEDGVHLGAGLHPLLLRVEHALGVVQILARTEAYKAVVRLGIVLVDEVYVVGAYETYAVFPRKLNQMLVHIELHGVGLVVGAFDRSLVKLQLEVVVVAEEILVPQYRFFGRLQISRRDHARHLAAQTCRTAYQPFVVLLQFRVVGTRTHVETFGPRLRDDLDEIVVSLCILGQKYEVISALVRLALLELQAAARYVDLATDDGLEVLLRKGIVFGLQSCHGSLLLGRGTARLVDLRLQGGDLLLGGLDLVTAGAVLLLDVVVELLYAEHVAVVGDGDAAHAVGNGLVHKALYAGLSIKNGILRVYVQMYEIVHCNLPFYLFNPKPMPLCRLSLCAGGLRCPYRRGAPCP